jgi:hypothetical protein
MKDFEITIYICTSLILAQNSLYHDRIATSIFWNVVLIALVIYDCLKRKAG